MDRMRRGAGWSGEGCGVVAAEMRGREDPITTLARCSGSCASSSRPFGWLWGGKADVDVSACRSHGKDETMRPP